MDHERARTVMHELNRILFLLSSERKAAKRREILDNFLQEKKGAPFEAQGIEKQLKILLGLNE